MTNLFEMEPEKYWSPSVPYTKEKKDEFLTKSINSGEFVCSEKYDGNWARYVFQDGVAKIQSRARGVAGSFGELQEKVPHIFKDLFNKIKDTSMIIGELYLPGGNDKDVGTILRCLPNKAIKRQEEKGYLHFKIFDVWYLLGTSYMDTPLGERIHWPLMRIRELFHDHPYISVVDYFPGSDAYNLLNMVLEKGGEGIVLQYAFGKPEPSKRPAWKSLKIKKEIYEDVDVFCSGFEPATREYNGSYVEDWPYWENVKTGEKINKKLYKEFYDGAMLEPISKSYYYGWVNSILCSVWKDGEAVQLCRVSGLTDEIKAEIKSDPNKFLYKPMRITGMEFSTNQKTGEISVRHPKFKGFRDDITNDECTYEKLFG